MDTIPLLLLITVKCGKKRSQLELKNELKMADMYDSSTFHFSRYFCGRRKLTATSTYCY